MTDDRCPIEDDLLIREIGVEASREKSVRKEHFGAASVVGDAAAAVMADAPAGSAHRRVTYVSRRAILTHLAG